MKIAIHLGQIKREIEESRALPDLAGLKKYKPDVVLFPEEYLRESDKESIEGLKQICSSLNAPFLVPAFGSGHDNDDYSLQYIEFWDDPLRNDIDLYYMKHTSAGCETVGWDYDSWELEDISPFKINGHQYGVTICHDLFLGGLHRMQKQFGAEVLLNATYFKVQDAKWGTLARLRALENAIPVIVALHADGNDAKHHPYAYDGNGQEMSGIRMRDGKEMLASKMCGGNETFIFDIPEAMQGSRKDAMRKLPACSKNIGPSVPRKQSVSAKMAKGEFKLEGNPTDVEIIRIDDMDLLDISIVFQKLHQAHQKGQKSIIWNHWKELEVPVEQWLHVMLGRSLEFSVPVVMTVDDKILEITERASDHKEIRRCSPRTTRAWIDIQRGDALSRSFNITTNHYKAKYKSSCFENSLQKYQECFRS